jgi:SAM-dependent methyltransferase
VKWEERYRAGEHGATDPSPLLVRFASELAPGRALDLGCGTGRNAIWLTRRGWSDVALDSAPTAIEVVRRVGIDGRVIDLEAGEPLPFDDASFDLVCSIRFLHRPLFAEGKRLLRPGGTFIGEFRQKPPFDIGEVELRQWFADWQILHVAPSEIVARV